VADDERVVREVVAALLCDEPDVTAATARTADEAVRATAQMHADLVLLDLGVPGLDGIEVARRLRRDPATADVPLVALTAARGADPPPALAIRCDAVVATPSDVEGLLGAVRHVRHRPTKAERDRRIADLLARAAEVTGQSVGLRRQAREVCRVAAALWRSRLLPR
jgi:two-component system phosphate regulon response regulator PhoB